MLYSNTNNLFFLTFLSVTFYLLDVRLRLELLLLLLLCDFFDDDFLRRPPLLNDFLPPPLVFALDPPRFAGVRPVIFFI